MLLILLNNVKYLLCLCIRKMIILYLLKIVRILLAILILKYCMRNCWYQRGIIILEPKIHWIRLLWLLRSMCVRIKLKKKSNIKEVFIKYVRTPPHLKIKKYKLKLLNYLGVILNVGLVKRRRLLIKVILRIWLRIISLFLALKIAQNLNNNLPRNEPRKRRNLWLFLYGFFWLLFLN